MEINLTPILTGDGGKIPIDLSFTPTQSPKDDFEFAAPVHIIGEAVNMGGDIVLTMHISTTLRSACGRCGDEVVWEFDADCEERLQRGADDLKNDESDPDIIYFSGYIIDIDDIVYRNIYLNLPMKVLCREDCKGLCPTCGCNLNEGSCDCDGGVTDPRFDILDKLL